MMKHFQFIIVACFLTLFSCVDTTFDQPPVNGTDPNIAATGTISDLIALHVNGQIEEITQDIVLSVLVTADDRSGNLYRTIVIQDETGGISFLLNDGNLYTRYPVGRRLFINTKGLYLSDYGNLPQLGFTPYDDAGDLRSGGIPSTLFDDYITPGSWNNPVTPTVINVNQLNNSHLNTLIKIEQSQFSKSAVGQTLADAVASQSVNHTLEDCGGGSILVRTSGFSNIATELVPGGSGSLTAVYTIFRTDKQLILRGIEDIEYGPDRCNVGGSQLTLKSIKDAFNNGAVNAPVGFVKGVVISDYASGNITGRNLYLQDGTGGIVIRFDANHSFALGKELTIGVGGLEISEFNGLLQLNNVPIDNVLDDSNGTLPTPVVKTIDEIKTNLEALESTRVLINDVELSGSNVFNGTLVLTDATGTIDMFTRSSASFANAEVPTGKVDITVIVSQFNAAQVLINNSSDIEGGTTGGGGGGGGTTDGVDEDFEGLVDRADVDIMGWTNVATKGTRLWQSRLFSGNFYAQATAFNDSSPEMETWLISPLVKKENANQLSFTSSMAFYVHDGLSVLWSSDFTGDPNTATWTTIDCKIAGSADGDNNWVSSGTIDISGIGKDIYIGFKYVGDNTTNTTTYRIDDILVK